MTVKFEALDKVKHDVIERLQFWRNDEPLCPHCGAILGIEDNEWFDLYEDGEHEKQCPQCDLEFIISTHVEYKFSTDGRE